jgi:hypothetical protein
MYHIRNKHYFKENFSAVKAAYHTTNASIDLDKYEI